MEGMKEIVRKINELQEVSLKQIEQIIGKALAEINNFNYVVVTEYLKIVRQMVRQLQITIKLMKIVIDLKEEQINQLS